MSMRHLTASAFIALLLLSTGPATAQSTDEGVETYLSSQVVRLLSSSDQESEAAALHLIIYHESRDEKNRFDFTKAAPQLVKIIEESRDEKQRVLAETALKLTDHRAWRALEGETARFSLPAVQRVISTSR